MTSSLGLLTLFVGGSLALVHDITKEPIEQAAAEARQAAIAAVLPSFDNDPIAEADTIEEGIIVFPARKGGESVGTAVQTYSDNGFSGNITLLVGLDKSGKVTGYRVLSHAETPGLGAKMDTWFAYKGTGHDVSGRKAPFTVSKDGGDIDAITGATITSRAFLEALNKASQAAGSGYVDSYTGATKTKK